jgi:hypothetical protein
MTISTKTAEEYGKPLNGIEDYHNVADVKRIFIFLGIHNTEVKMAQPAELKASLSKKRNLLKCRAHDFKCFFFAD